ncbi:MAG: LysR family transcriptional regulator, partial [Firmicutes bacterium]|nr:LysR family transcriptional regulator [Bacillota bacterium]
PMLFREKGSASRKSAERLLELLGKDLRDVEIAASLNDQEAIKNLVEHGFGVSFISSLAAADREKESRLLLFDTGLAEAKRTFYLIRRKIVQLSESAEDFVKFICK